MASTNEVLEVVLERHIFNVEFRIDEARLINKVPYEAGERTLRNDTNFEDTRTVEISYEDRKAYTFSRGSSTPGVVSTTITTGLPFIKDGGIIKDISQISNELFQWGVPTIISSSATVSATVTVPPKSTVVVKYVGTQGTCSIPYVYTQEDMMSNGQIIRTLHVDGTYNGVSLYDFKFQTDQAQPL